MLTDTHVHFDGLIGAGEAIGAIMARAAAAGVSRMVAVGGSPSANLMAVEIARAYPAAVRAAVGYNRDWADAQDRASDDLEALRSLLEKPETAALGEIGLDFYRERATAARQIGLFRRMLSLARDHRLPVCVHTRAAEAATLAALREHAAAWRGAPDRIGVMHCFTGGEAFARELLALGFCVSFSGILTFKNAGDLPAVAALAPEDRLLIETDSPYLAPEPFRGRANEPARVRRVAEALAAIRRTSWETIAAITTRNAERLFGSQA